MAKLNYFTLVNPVKIELSYIDWGVPCREIWAADTIEYDEATINKWLEDTVMDMFRLEEPIHKYNVYLDDTFVSKLTDSIIIE